MPANSANITAWFTDAATRHPDILHSATNKRFFELEWDEMIENGQALSVLNWTLILEDYVEQPRDNDGDYVSIVQTISFMVVKHVPIGDVDAKKLAFEKGRSICWDIIAKMKADEGAGIEGCDPDVPAGVSAPHFEDLNSTRIIVVQPDFLDHACGARATVLWRTDNEVDLSRNRVAWVALP
jgi:hypothetical protein